MINSREVCLMKKLIIVLLAAFPLLHTGCYTRLALVRGRTIDAENYVIVEEATDDIACTYNEDYGYDSYSIWDWDLCYDPFRPSWYLRPYIGCSPIWPWPYTWYTPYWDYRRNYYWSYSPAFWYRNTSRYLWQHREKRPFDRRQSLHTAGTGSTPSSAGNILSFFDKRTLLNGNSRSINPSNNPDLRLRKTAAKSKPGIFTTLKETYHRISKYNSGNGSVSGSLAKAASHIRRASGGASRSKSSSGSGSRQRTRK